MKINVHIEWTVPGWLKTIVRASLPLSILVGGGVALAMVKHTFKPGDQLTSAYMNDNFQDLDTRLSALESSVLAPTMTSFTSPGSTNYTLPAKKPLYLEIWMVGPGGGGASNGISNNVGNPGNTATSFGPLVAEAGAGGAPNAIAAGGTANCGAVTTCIPITGNEGGGYIYTMQYSSGGYGGASPLFGGGAATPGGGFAGTNGTSPGAGGSGGGSGSTAIGVGIGGGSGGAIRAIIANPAPSYTVVVGAGGSGGAAGGAGGYSGGNGHDGAVFVWEHYQ